jgi:hypothetical protein
MACLLLSAIKLKFAPVARNQSSFAVFITIIKSLFANMRGQVMRKTLVFGVFSASIASLGMATLGATVARSAAGAEATPDLTTGRSLANAPFLSSTGQTVPHAGAPGGGQPGTERQIHDRNDSLIRKGICSNC